MRTQRERPRTLRQQLAHCKPLHGSVAGSGKSDDLSRRSQSCGICRLAIRATEHPLQLVQALLQTPLGRSRRATSCPKGGYRHASDCSPGDAPGQFATAACAGARGSPPGHLRSHLQSRPDAWTRMFPGPCAPSQTRYQNQSQHDFCCSSQSPLKFFSGPPIYSGFLMLRTKLPQRFKACLAELNGASRDLDSLFFLLLNNYLAMPLRNRQFTDRGKPGLTHRISLSPGRGASSAFPRHRHPTPGTRRQRA